MTFEWDEKKNISNQRKHGVSFEEAQDIGAKVGDDMKKNIYTDPDKDITDALDAAVETEDFLPPPSALVKKIKKEKITILLDASCIRFFKAAAKKNRTKYQNMINSVLSKYADHYSGNQCVSDSRGPKYKA